MIRCEETTRGDGSWCSGSQCSRAAKVVLLCATGKKIKVCTAHSKTWSNRNLERTDDPVETLAEKIAAAAVAVTNAENRVAGHQRLRETQERDLANTRAAIAREIVRLDAARAALAKARGEK